MNQNVKSHLVKVLGKILLIHTFLNTTEHQGSQENEKRPANFLKAKAKNSYCILYKKYLLHFGTIQTFDF